MFLVIVVKTGLKTCRVCGIEINKLIKKRKNLYYQVHLDCSLKDCCREVS